MMAWKSYPLIRLIVPYALGTAIGLSYRPSFIPLYILQAVLFSTCLSLYLSRKFQADYTHRWVLGGLIQVLLFSAGLTWAAQRPTGMASNHFSNFGATEELHLLARLTSSPEVTEKSVKANARIMAIYAGDDSLVRTVGKIRLVLARDSMGPALRYGDIIWIEADINDIGPPENPTGFDYRRYLSRQDIYHQGWVGKGQWLKAGEGGNFMVKKATLLRDHLESRLMACQIKGDELALAAAILLGSKDSLDQDLRQSYADAGVTHILSVSGLHVGVVYLALNFIFFFASGNPVLRKVRPLVIMAGIWCYAFLTGLSPSVLRASFMFSMFLVGSGFKRTGNIFNSLSAAAFFLMILDPAILSRVGFQLSFLAVLGIATFDNKINPLWKPRVWWLDKGWQLMTVSISAQLGTLPLSLYYFNSFPVYFLPANLVIIPISSLVIYLGASFFLADQLLIFPDLVARVFNASLVIMNTLVEFFHSLPGSAIRPIVLSQVSILLLILLLASFAATWGWKKYRDVMFLETVAVIFMFTILIRHFQVSRQSCMVIYKSRDIPVADLITGRTCHCLGDSIGLAEAGIKRYTYGPFREERGVRDVNYHTIPMNPDIQNVSLQIPVYRFMGRTILTISNPVTAMSFSSPPGIDYLWIKGKYSGSKNEILEQLKPGMVILDGNLPWREAQDWKTICADRKTPLHSIREEGAFYISW